MKKNIELDVVANYTAIFSGIVCIISFFGIWGDSLWWVFIFLLSGHALLKIMRYIFFLYTLMKSIEELENSKDNTISVEYEKGFFMFNEGRALEYALSEFYKKSPDNFSRVFQKYKNHMIIVTIV